MQAKRMKEKGRHRRKERNFNTKKVTVFIILNLALIALILVTTKVITNKNKYEKDKIRITREGYDLEKNVSEKLLEERKFDNLIIKNVKINVEEGVSEFNAIVENNSNEDFKAKDVYIIFKKENGEDIIRFKYALKDLEKKNKSEISLISTVDLTLANDFCIEQ